MIQVKNDISKVIATTVIIFTALISSGQDRVLDVLYEKKPMSNGITQPEEYYEGGRVRNVSKAQIYVYLPEKKVNTGAATIICAGGGFTHESLEHEGHKYARFLQEHGIAGIVLKYRMPNGNIDIPILDTKNAMRMVRANAEQWYIDSTKIGITGFSAGGRLASTLGTSFDNGKKNAEKKFARYGCRPDFMILIYAANKVEINEKTPPAFICCCNDDITVDPINSLSFFRALKEFNIPAELHIFNTGGHGFGMQKQGLPIDDWPNLVVDWLSTMKFVEEHD